MSIEPRVALSPQRHFSASVRGLAAALCPLCLSLLVLLLAACVEPGRGGRVDVPASPGRAAAPGCALPPLSPAARSTCPHGVRPIGVLAVLSDTVCRNNRRAVNGERVCDGDQITTNANGMGEVLPDCDSESDSVHIAEGTDPRFTWTLAGCLSIDGYRYGRIIATAQRRCMVIRTPDTLMLLLNGRAQFQVTQNTSTRVVPLRGSVTKLQPLSARQVHELAPAQLSQLAARAALQPHVESVNVYSNHDVAQPSERLPPAEIRRLDRNPGRR